MRHACTVNACGVAAQLNARVRTSGIVTKEFKFKGNDFCMYDVGGQRMERRKWVQYFDHANSLIFAATISEYNQVTNSLRH